MMWYVFKSCSEVEKLRGYIEEKNIPIKIHRCS